MYSLVLNIKHLITLVFQGNLNGSLDDVFDFEDQCYAVSVHSSNLGDKGIHPTAPGIYFISSPDSDKVYVGSTSNLARRRSQHHHDLQKGHINPNLNALLEKHDRSSFRFTSMEIYAPRETLYLVEQHLYDLLRGKDLILNTGLDIRASWKGREMPEELRTKLALAKIGTSGHENQLKAMEKLWKDDDFRQRKSESSKKKWEDPDYRKKMLEATLGSTHSQERKDKISNSLKGRVKTNSRQVSILGEIYPTINHAVEATGTPSATLRRWLDSDSPRYALYYYT